MRCPSGLHCGPRAPVESWVIRSASPPVSRFSTYTCGASSPSRFAEKASRLPSGLHVAPASAPRLWVSRRGADDPSVITSHRSLDCSLGSYAGSVTENTTRVPSGLSTGPPTRFISHTSSCVIGRGVTTAGVPATVGAGATVAVPPAVPPAVPHGEAATAAS